MKTFDEIKNIALKIGFKTNQRNTKISSDYQDFEKYKKLNDIEPKNFEWIRSPEETAVDGYGSCYEQTIYINSLLTEIGIITKVIYMFTEEKYDKINLCYDKSTISHLALIYKDNDRWKWLEWSWRAQIQNKFEYEKLEEMLNAFKNMATNSWHSPAKVIDVTDLIEYSCPRLLLFRKFIGR